MSTSAIAPTGKDYNTVFEKPMHGGGVSDRQRNRLVLEERRRLERQGIEPATVVNLNRFPLTINLGDLGCLEVPPANDAGPGSMAIETIRISLRDLGDSNFTPVGVLPKELAKELVREYGSTGGVFWYCGTGEPEPKALAEAEEAQKGWWRSEYQKAVDAWSRYHQHKMITDRQRDAARELFKLQEIEALPEWVVLTRRGQDRRDCPECGESIKAVARICHFCRHTLETEKEG